MRSLTKFPEPEVLATNAADWLTAYLADPDSNTKRYRYRHSDIKTVLRDETGWKCVYCESYIGHNTPGDIEHKVPTSHDPNLHFTWDNLTIACTECNRRKNDFYDENSGFLDPYSDLVEEMTLHVGPLLFWKPGETRAELALRLLQLHNMDRAQLVQSKIDTLEKARAIADLIAAEPDPLLRSLRLNELQRMQGVTAEYSACVRTFVEQAIPEAIGDSGGA